MSGRDFTNTRQIFGCDMVGKQWFDGWAKFNTTIYNFPLGSVHLYSMRAECVRMYRVA